MSDKAEESTVGTKNQMKYCGKPITELPFKKRLSMVLLSVREEVEGSSQPEGSAMSSEDARVNKGGLIHRPGSDALVGGIFPSCLSADDPMVTEMSVSGDMPDQLLIPVKINMEIKEQLKKEIRHFGGKYEIVFKLLEGVQGPPEVQKKFALYAMKEAARYERQDLIRHLKKVPEKLESDQFLKKDNDTPNLQSCYGNHQ
ncbi:cancer/testis antigen family 45 member A6-like isoform X1 [Lutra lutra]|uniref:cancer/testis antigen family 45 member A6-like isoform X1 n=1 Tax=Lutra lutra TaxID=9657 RepID=UPI001FD1BDF8|nr:cancer/testis antigen family 45 member A6-like isoform X1 [Lutra lutra]